LASQITGKRELDDMNDEELSLLGSTLSGRTSEITEEKDQREQEQVDIALVRNTSSMQEPFVDEDVVSDLGVDEEDGEYTVKQETIILRERNEQMVVTVEDLDANFEISFVEGGRTPLSDAAMQQNLVALMQPYMALWDAATKGGPQGIIAKNYMQVLADRFDLPKDLHPDELKSELDEEQKESKESKKDQVKPKESKDPEVPQEAQAPPEEAQVPPEEAQAPPEESVPAGPEQPPTDPAQMLEQISQLPPGEAIEALKQVFGNQPEIIQVLDQISQMPPEQQGEAIQQVLEAASANV